MDLTGTTALVTGASRGIGRAIATRLAVDGAAVAVHYGTNQAAAAQTVGDIRRAGGKAFPLQADLGDDASVDTLVTTLETELAGYTSDARLDILVNNAAVVPRGTVQHITREQFRRTMAVNVAAPLFLVQGLLPLLRDGGRIVTISSLVTKTAPPEIGYVMSKGALDAMGRSLAGTLGSRGITVNTVAPGLTATDVFPAVRDNPDDQPGIAAATALGRVGQPEDVADVVAFLASPRARWVTGQIVDATGGLFLSPRVPIREGG